MSSTLIFDIETVGEDFDTLDQVTQDSLVRWTKREPIAEQERLVDEVKNNLGLSPLTGRIVAIGVLDDEKGRGAVYFDVNGKTTTERKEGESHREPVSNGIKLKPMNEKEMLENFWRGVAEYETFVSFNGRGFDVPFLMVRSAVHGIRPTKDLMSNRYTESQDQGARHIDLMDQLSFYGAVRRRGSLHMWCRAFGIKSPKATGVSGADIGRLYKEERFEDIARYNAGDLAAMRELYHLWRKTMAF